MPTLRNAGSKEHFSGNRDERSGKCGKQQVMTKRALAKERAAEDKRKGIVEDLVLDSLEPDDKSLPKPRGWMDKKRTPKSDELAKLEATRKLGGLVPDRIGGVGWQCSQCSSIYENCMEAKACCRAHANQIQVCSKCCHRVADCVCRNQWSEANAA
jgi:hypothetical protein